MMSNKHKNIDEHIRDPSDPKLERFEIHEGSKTTVSA